MSGRFLVKRGRRYHLRVRVPVDLVPLFGRSEIQRALGTTDFRTARAMASSLTGRLNEQFAQLRYRAALAISLPELVADARLVYGHRLPATRTSVIASHSGGQLQGRGTILTLRQAVERFLRDREGRWEPKTLLMQGAALELFVRIVGDKALAAVSRDDCRAFRDTLVRLPPNMTKRFAGKSIAEVVKLAPAPMTAKNANRILSALTSFMSWSHREGHIDQSPAKGLLIPLEIRADKERDAFEASDLVAIFGTLGPASGARFWVPAVALYTGLRLEEVCQLHVHDLCDIEGALVIQVQSGDGKRLKTVQSERIVPLHSRLIELGLWKCRQGAIEEGRRELWSGLMRGADGTFSSAFSKWFGRHKAAMGITSRKRTFHSFRHTFLNSLKQLGVEEAIIRELAGHANGSITTGRYGKRYGIEVCSNAVQRLSFDAP